LDGLIGFIDGDRTVVMVVMRFTLPMQHGVGSVLGLGKDRGLARDGKDLPKQRKGQESKNKPAGHQWSLAQCFIEERSSQTARACGLVLQQRKKRGENARHYGETTQ
jgi:hypothetical protein